MIVYQSMLRPMLPKLLGLPKKTIGSYSTTRFYCSQANQILKRKRFNQIIIASSLCVAGIGLLSQRNRLKAKIIKDSRISSFSVDAGNRKDGLKEFGKDEVSLHNNPEKGIWIIYRNGVYDITKFVEQHPGGDKILLGAGQDIEPFWNLYAAHKNADVYKLLETYRIGNLRPSDVNTDGVNQSNDPYQDDPKRPGYFNVRSAKPFNAEPPLNILSDSWITPNELFYIRNHLPVPSIQPDEYELEIEGFGLKKGAKLTLKELKTKFPKHSIYAAIQCAGNRRSEMTKVKEVRGLFWGGAAISNAKWSGARLIDVLSYLGVDLNDPRVKHLQFDGADTDATGTSYGASVPAETALDEKSQFLLAYEMNDVDLPRDHGYPVRLVAPGIAGARNVKWLNKITLSDEESHSHWQRKDYKGFSPNVDWDTVNFDESPSIQDMPIQSSICDPIDGATVIPDAEGFITIKGYAWSGGGRKVIRVDVSPDGGTNWVTADLEQEDSPLKRTYSWTLWKARINVESCKKGDSFQVVCKAIDSSYNNQPETVEPIWNLRGVLTNSWSRVNLKLS